MKTKTSAPFNNLRLALLLPLVSTITACQPPPAGKYEAHAIQESAKNHYEDDLELLIEQSEVMPFACQSASSSQLKQVNDGNIKLSKFVQQCARATGNSAWCAELTRPNPASHATFHCTYSSKQAHSLIHPDENTWKHAFGAVLLIQELEQKGLRVCSIYNWWRPEPYNKNVGGAAGRHPYGTSVDVRFCSNSDANRAFDELCKLRKQGKIRAIGHYGTSALHFGMGDSVGNTWGRSCPR